MKTFREWLNESSAALSLIKAQGFKKDSSWATNDKQEDKIGDLISVIWNMKKMNKFKSNGFESTYVEWFEFNDGSRIYLNYRTTNGRNAFWVSGKTNPV